MKHFPITLIVILLISVTQLVVSQTEETEQLPGAVIDGTAPGWRTLTLSDFTNVNCYEDTWSEKDGVIFCTGKPVGVMRSNQVFTNYELVVQWRHLKPGGNSGMFQWVPGDVLEGMKPDSLPGAGIEVQMLVLDYRRQYEENSGKRGIGSPPMVISSQ